VVEILQISADIVYMQAKSRKENYISRRITISHKSTKSLFLFGPRQSGKTTLLKKRFSDAPYYNLLIDRDYIRFLTDPSVLRDEVLALSKDKMIVIDEIQRVPALLNEVHALIEDGYRFILTGSSARKLKRGSSNLLAGRARWNQLFPLSIHELKKDFNFKTAFHCGMLPSLYYSDEPEIDLLSYVNTYLKEEIAAEALTRNIQLFSKFLKLAAMTNTQVLNYSKISIDVGLSSTVIKNYYQILEDTFIGYFLNPLNSEKKRKAVTTPKFYFFDVGISNYIAKRKSIEKGTPYFGDSLEHLIHNEIKAYLSYFHPSVEMNYWRTRDQKEVDFVINKNIAIEVKSSNKVKSSQKSGLQALSEEIELKKKIIIYTGERAMSLENSTDVLPLYLFVEKLWKHEILERT